MVLVGTNHVFVPFSIELCFDLWHNHIMLVQIMQDEDKNIFEEVFKMIELTQEEIEARRAYHREWSENNREKRKESNARYWQKYAARKKAERQGAQNGTCNNNQSTRNDDRAPSGTAAII